MAPDLHSCGEEMVFKFNKGGRQVLVYECIGFLLIIALTWFDELQSWSQYLFGGTTHVRDWRDSAIQTLFVVYVWAIVVGLTKRLLDHLHRLEGLLKVCAWCRKVGQHGKWVKMEQYFAESFQIGTTHGMCPDCLERVKEETSQFRKKELEQAARFSAADATDEQILGL